MKDSTDVEEKALSAAASKAATASVNKKSNPHHTNGLEKAHGESDPQPSADKVDAAGTQPFSQSNPPNAPTQLSSGAHSCIGTQMRALYNDLLQEETPERFLKLLEELDRKGPPQ